MKFLENKDIKVEKGNIKVIFKPVTIMHQSVLLGYNADLCNAIKANDLGLNIHAQMKMAVYALNEMIVSLIVDGEELDPKQVADCADISDTDTFNALKNIYQMASDLLVRGHTKKKSSTPPKSTGKGKGAKNAPVQTKG